MGNPNTKDIMILGMGNFLFTDEGFGIRVIEELIKRCSFWKLDRVIDMVLAAVDRLEGSYQKRSDR
jgi:Ni,Fe-hydrogenase maturation factor